MIRPSHTPLNTGNVVLVDSVFRPYDRMVPRVLTNPFGLLVRKLSRPVPLSPTTSTVCDHVFKISLACVLSKVMNGIVRSHTIPMAYVQRSVSGAVERLKYHVMDQRHRFFALATQVYLHVAVLTGALRFQLTSNKIDPAVNVIAVPVQGSNPAQGRHLIVPFISNYLTPFFGHCSLLFDGVNVSRVFSHVN